MSNEISSTDLTLLLGTVKSMDDKLSKLADKMVPSEWCKSHREHCLSENGQNFHEIYDRLKCCEKQCSVFEAMFPTIPSEADILEARETAVEKAAAASRADNRVLVSRLDNIDDKLKIFDASYWSACKLRELVKGNKMVTGIVAFFIMSSIGDWLTFIGVLLGRIHDFML